MALDSNMMTDRDGFPLPHFTQHPSPQSCGVNVFAQDLSNGAPFLDHPYVFPPLSLVDPVLRFLKAHRRPCTLVVLDVYPRKYWWPLVKNCSRKSYKLADKRGRWSSSISLHTRMDSSCGDPWGSLGISRVLATSSVWMKLNDSLCTIAFCHAFFPEHYSEIYTIKSFDRIVF